MYHDSDEALAHSLSTTPEPDAFETLYRRSLQQVYSLARSYFRIREDAEEATSETFVRAFRALRAGQFRGDALFRTWLARIAVNVCLERLRQPRLPLLNLDDIGELAAPRDVREPVRDAIEELADAHRMILILRDVHGYSAEELARIIGKPVAATKSLHYRARRALREALIAAGREE